MHVLSFEACPPLLVTISMYAVSAPFAMSQGDPSDLAPNLHCQEGISCDLAEPAAVPLLCPSMYDHSEQKGADLLSRMFYTNLVAKPITEGRAVGTSFWTIFRTSFMKSCRLQASNRS